MSTGFGARSALVLITSRVLVIATDSAIAAGAEVCGCVPMMVTLRNEVASAIPAHAADALVDLMTVLAVENCVLSATIFAGHGRFGCGLNALLRSCY